MTKIIFSGFGGQGVLTLGQIVATIAMNRGHKVTWMPSYGPEMRGGTANCAVIISDKVIGTPIVANNIDILVAMNAPSIDKFLPKVRKDGLVIVNSSTITAEITRSDVKVLKIDATNIASGLGNLKVQNMVMLAGFLRETKLFEKGDILAVLEEKFGEKYPKLIPLNMEAVEKGLA